jgi:hypothetical protein
MGASATSADDAASTDSSVRLGNGGKNGCKDSRKKQSLFRAENSSLAQIRRPTLQGHVKSMTAAGIRSDHPVKAFPNDTEKWRPELTNWVAAPLRQIGRRGDAERNMSGPKGSVRSLVRKASNIKKMMDSYEPAPPSNEEQNRNRQKSRNALNTLVLGLQAEKGNYNSI